MPPVKVIFHNSPSPKTSPKGDSDKKVQMLQSAQTLRQLCHALESELTNEREKLEVKLAVRAQLGEVLSGSTPAWAAPGNRTFSKTAFRQEVRKLLDKPDTKEIDDLFEELDVDRSGSLNASELKVAMKKLINTAKEVKVAQKYIYERVSSLEVRLEQALAVANVTQAAEEAQAQLEVLRENKTIQARVGALLAARNTKIADIVSLWENTKGEVSRPQFRRNLRGIGLDERGLEESDTLFAELDTDGGGTLDLAELKVALHRLQEAAKTADKEVRSLRKATLEQWREVRAAQAALQERKRQDEAAEKKRLVVMEEEQRSKAAAAEAERKKKAAAAAEARKRKAENIAAFEAKIVARRSTLLVASGA